MSFVFVKTPWVYECEHTEMLYPGDLWVQEVQIVMLFNFTGLINLGE